MNLPGVDGIAEVAGVFGDGVADDVANLCTHTVPLSHFEDHLADEVDFVSLL